jgi:hypothetical protein
MTPKNGMTDDGRGPLDDPLAPDDVLAQAITQLPEMQPTRDLWPGVQARISVPEALSGVGRPALSEVVSMRRGGRVEGKGYVSVTWPQLALAASLLMAVTVSLTWLVARQPATAPVAGVVQGARGDQVVRAESEPMGSLSGDIQKANFADAQYDKAVADLEKILEEARDQLDPRTVMVIERNLQTIDEAIREAREALDRDPANTYLNSHLADARRRKLELLRHATALASTGGD